MMERLTLWNTKQELMDSEFLMELIFHLVANMQVGNLSKFHVTILMALNLPDAMYT